MNNNNFLRHYGILGMRWRRRNGSVAVNRVNDHNDGDSEDHVKKRALSRKRLNEMSNAELKEFTTRLQLEKQYKELTKVEVSKGKRIITEILGTAAKQTASKYTAEYMDKAVKRLLSEAAK